MDVRYALDLHFKISNILITILILNLVFGLPSCRYPRCFPIQNVLFIISGIQVVTQDYLHSIAHERLNY
jgi:hypothetical protein